MALIWCDGFDHYGSGSSGRDNMLDGVWAEFSSLTPRPESDNPRTGTHALRFGSSPTNPTAGYARRIFGADKDVVGLGYAAWFRNLPTLNTIMVLAEFRTNGNDSQCTFTLTTTGQIEFRRGGRSGTVLGTSDPIVTAGAYQHIEFRVFVDDSSGSGEARVNGVTVLDVSGVDTKQQGAAGAAQVRFGNDASTGSAVWYIDDLFAWDDQGGVVDTFVGDQRVFFLFPNDDTVDTDWERNTGSTDYEQIDDPAPDDDTTYIAADTVGDISVFELEDLPAAVNAVTAVQLVGRLRKTDAGACNVQMGLLSADIGSPPAPALVNGADRPMTEVYTYWSDVIHNDPATGAPWAPAAFDAARFRIERTA